MAWKWFKNDWSIAGFLLFWAQLGWAVYFISILFGSLLFLIELFLGGTLGIQDLTARIRVHEFSDLIINSEAESIFQKSIFETTIDTLNTEIENKWCYYIASLMTIGLDGIILYGLTLLKRILESLRQEDPWNDHNSTNLKVIGYLMLFAVPYKHGIGWLTYLMVDQIQLPENISLFWPPIAWELGLAGLAVLLVAYIFEEGTRLYEEQKLTV